MITLKELNEQIRAALKSSRISSTESVATENALGRVVARDVVSKIAMPGSHVSAMDGYAVCSKNDIKRGQSFINVGISKAGEPFLGVLKNGECIRILTGAVVPEDATTVVMQEDVEVSENYVVLTCDTDLKKNIRFAGEELQVGETILATGTHIRPPEVLLLASCGFSEVEVFSMPKIGVFSTGDELVPPGETPLKTGEVYDSNRITIKTLLSQLPVTVVDYGLVEDTLESTLKTLAKAADECDIIITSGGVSVGDFDYLKDAVSQLGEIHQYKVKMKPGKPFVFGKIDHAWYFGLPGNPVSAFVGFTQIISPAIYYTIGVDKIETLSLNIPLATSLKKKPGRQDFQRGVLEKYNDQWLVSPQGSQDSHRVYALARANCFIVMDAEDGDKNAGDIVTVIPFSDSFSMGGWL